jgi:hypothetical protein
LSRLIIVSNRVALPGEGAQRSGGLVTGLVDALHQAGGAWRWLAAAGMQFNSVRITVSTICRVSFVCTQARIEAE